jgi:hypothetical protein
MTPRLAARVEVSALIRRIETEGGTGLVIARGHAEAGAILLILADRGQPKTLLERILDVSGSYRWRSIGTQYLDSYQELNDYIQRRRRSDEDLWVVELDIAGVERFAAEMTAMG